MPVMNSQQGTEPKGVSRPSRGADGLQRQALETQAAVGVDVPTHEGAAGPGPAASRPVYPTSVRDIDPELWRQLRAMAVIQRVTIGELLNQVIEEWLRLDRLTRYGG